MVELPYDCITNIVLIFIIIIIIITFMPSGVECLEWLKTHVEMANCCYYFCLFCFCCRIICDSGLLPVGRSWHSFTPITSGQILLYGGYTNDQVPLGE